MPSAGEARSTFAAVISQVDHRMSCTGRTWPGPPAPAQRASYRQTEAWLPHAPGEAARVKGISNTPWCTTGRVMAVKGRQCGLDLGAPDTGHGAGQRHPSTPVQATYMGTLPNYARAWLKTFYLSNLKHFQIKIVAFFIMMLYWTGWKV